MITNALDQFENFVTAEDATNEGDYYCPYCGIKMFRVKRTNAYFRRREGEEHRKAYCRALVNSPTKIVFRKKSITDFIDELLTPVTPARTIPPVSPAPPVPPAPPAPPTPQEEGGDVPSENTNGEDFSVLSIPDTPVETSGEAHESFVGEVESFVTNTPDGAVHEGESEPFDPFDPGNDFSNPFYPEDKKETEEKEDPADAASPEDAGDKPLQERGAKSLKDIADYDVINDIAAGNKAVGPLNTLKDYILCFRWAEDIYSKWTRLGKRSTKKAIVFCKLDGCGTANNGSEYYRFSVFWNQHNKSKKSAKFTLFCNDQNIVFWLNKEISKIRLPDDEEGHQHFREHHVLICGEWKRGKLENNFTADLKNKCQVYFWEEDNSDL